jgi:hypothetical protein
MRGWLAGLVGMIVGTLALSAWMFWISVDLQMDVHHFYTSQNEQVEQETYEFWDRVSRNSYTLQTLAIPVLTAGVIAAFALIAVLARRWDVVNRRSVETEAPYETEASAAS